MRWPLLYARSHRVPAAALTAVAGIGLLGLLARAGENPQIAALARSWTSIAPPHSTRRTLPWAPSRPMPLSITPIAASP